MLPVFISPEAKYLRSEIKELASNSLSKGSSYLYHRDGGNSDSGFEEGKIYMSNYVQSNKSLGKKANKKLE